MFQVNFVLLYYKRIKYMLDGIKRIATKSMAERVEMSLQEYFKVKKIKPGDALPTEMELAAALGVSRNVLREALSRFKMLGIIETKKKVGMVVSNPDIPGTLEKMLHPAIIDDATLQDLFELRLVLEAGIADILYLRVTDKDILELEEISGKEVKGDFFRLANEIAFHGKLYEITGNETLKKFQAMLLPVFAYVIKLENKKQVSGKVNHKDLVNILKKGTPEQYKVAITAHLKPHLDKLRNKK